MKWSNHKKCIPTVIYRDQSENATPTLLASACDRLYGEMKGKNKAQTQLLNGLQGLIEHASK